MLEKTLAISFHLPNSEDKSLIEGGNQIEELEWRLKLDFVIGQTSLQ